MIYKIEGKSVKIDYKYGGKVCVNEKIAKNV